MVEIPSQDILQLYASLMSEVKARLASIDAQRRAMRDMKDQVQISFLLEFCYLQLRRVTELTAIGVLVAHNVLPEFRGKGFIKEWNADALMRQLAKLNPDAFPTHAQVWPIPDNHGSYVIVPTKAHPRPREDICRIYTECSDKLHTGHVKRLLSERNKTYSAAFIREASHTLYNHLNQHVIKLPDGRLMQADLQLHAPGPVRCQWMGLDPPPPSG